MKQQKIIVWITSSFCRKSKNFRKKILIIPLLVLESLTSHLWILHTNHFARCLHSGPNLCSGSRFCQRDQPLSTVLTFVTDTNASTIPYMQIFLSKYSKYLLILQIFLYVPNLQNSLQLTKLCCFIEDMFLI